MIRTALTSMFGLRHPIVSAPMGSVAGGTLAAAVSNAGGLGLVGGGYGDAGWLREELGIVQRATRRPWGVGLITWAIEGAVLDLASEAIDLIRAVEDAGTLVERIGIEARNRILRTGELAV